jgi:hypothetical protein
MDENEEDILHHPKNLGKKYISFRKDWYLDQRINQTSDEITDSVESSRYGESETYSDINSLDSNDSGGYIFKSRNHDIKFNKLIFSDNPYYINAFRNVTCKAIVYNNSNSKLDALLEIKLLKGFNDNREILITIVRDIKSLRPKGLGTLSAEYNIERMNDDGPSYMCLFAEIQPKELNVAEMLFDVY